MVWKKKQQRNYCTPPPSPKKQKQKNPVQISMTVSWYGVNVLCCDWTRLLCHNLLSPITPLLSPTASCRASSFSFPLLLMALSLANNVELPWPPHLRKLSCVCLLLSIKRKWSFSWPWNTNKERWFWIDLWCHWVPLKADWFCKYSWVSTLVRDQKRYFCLCSSL